MIGKIVDYLKESKSELAKVTWPQKKEVIKLTAVVLAASLGVAIYLGLLDTFFTKLTQIIIENKK